MGGDLLATGSRDGTAKVWNINNRKLLHTFKGHEQCVRVVALHGNTLATGSLDGNAKVYDLSTGAWLHTFESEGESGPIEALAIQSTVAKVSRIRQSIFSLAGVQDTTCVPLDPYRPPRTSTSTV